ncbi:MAG: DUF2244 domain-containing protein [Desulfobacteraceae bacterium]|nr:MAG: DUF2244 domain-containing protein [Desulfobacteraceae bacterium]
MGHARNVAWLFALAVAALSIGVVLADSINALMLMLAFAGALVAGAIYFVVSLTLKLRHPDQVAVDVGTVWYRTGDRRRGWDTRSIPIAEVVNIALRAESQGEQVVVESKNSKLAFGAALTDRARQRLRDLLLFLVCFVRRKR